MLFYVYKFVLQAFMIHARLSLSIISVIQNLISVLKIRLAIRIGIDAKFMFLYSLRLSFEHHQKLLFISVITLFVSFTLDAYTTQISHKCYMH